jgi:hypothetical protein
MEEICLTLEEDSYYYWTLVINELQNTSDFLNLISEVINKFEEKFFKIARGNTEGLKNVCEEVHTALKKLIPNYQKFTFDLYSFSFDLFTKLHSQMMDLQVQKAMMLLEEMQSKYKFNFYYERILLSNQRLEDKKNEYLSAVFNLKEFRAESLKKLYLDNLKNFMENFNTNTPSEIEFKCCGLEEEFIHEVDIMVSLNKRKLKEFIEENFARRNIVVLSLGTVKVFPVESQQSFTVRYKTYLQTERVSLLQVVSLSNDTYLPLVRFADSDDCFFIIVNKNERYQLEVQDKRDPNIVVATGSNQENLVLFCNQLRLMSKGYIVKNKTYQETQRFMFDSGASQVLSAAYLQIPNEVIYLNNSRVLSYKSFTSKTRSISSIETYGFSKIESNGEFLFLTSYDQFSLANSDLQIVFREDRHVTHCFLNGKKLVLSVFEGQGDFSLTESVISDEYFKSTSAVKNFLFKAKYELKSNFHHGFSALSDIIKTNEFIVEDQLNVKSEKNEEGSS